MNVMRHSLTRGIRVEEVTFLELQFKFKFEFGNNSLLPCSRKYIIIRTFQTIFNHLPSPLLYEICSCQTYHAQFFDSNSINCYTKHTIRNIPMPCLHARFISGVHVMGNFKIESSEIVEQTEADVFDSIVIRFWIVLSIKVSWCSNKT